jgi:hypothetical protein
VLVVLGAMLGGPINAVLGVGDPLACALCGAWVGLAYGGAAARGVLLGRQRWRAVSGQLVVSSAARLLLGVVLTPSLGLLGAMVATVCAEAGATIAAIVPIWSTDATRRGRELRRGRGDVGHALGTQLGLWVLATLGVVLARRVLEPADAGRFAAAATATSGALFVPMALAGAMFPRFAAGVGGRALRRTLAAGVAIGAALILGAAVAGPELVQVAAGRDFRPAVIVVSGLACCVAALGVAAVDAQYLLARRHPASMATWVAAVAVTGLTLLTRPGPHGFVALLAASGVITAVVMTTIALRLDRRTGAPTTSTLPAPILGLSIVLPSYNDGDRLRQVVEATVEVIARTGLDGEVIVVLDGSTDGSARTLAGLPPVVRVVELATNRGKGAAVTLGFAQSRGRLVGYLDADGDLDPSVIEHLVTSIATEGTWCSAGSRCDPVTVVRVTPARRVLTVVYRRLVRQIFQLEVRDTQCGAKLFERDALGQLLTLARERRFAFDLELLALGQRLGLGRVSEVPVLLHRPPGARSRVNARAVGRTGLDTLRLWARVAEAPLRAPAQSAASPAELTSPSAEVDLASVIRAVGATV